MCAALYIVPAVLFLLVLTDRQDYDIAFAPQAIVIALTATLVVAVRVARLRSGGRAAPRAQEDYVRALIAANGKVVADAAKARDLAGAGGDAESQDLMIERITLHQKTIWMLKSFLKS